MKRLRTLWKVLLSLLLMAILGINVIAYLHAYKFTHFSGKAVRTADPDKLSWMKKISTLISGIDNPRPVNHSTPSSFTTVFIPGEYKLEGWLTRVPNARGTVILFHGYASMKSSLLDRATFLNSSGYSSLLVDFRGSGGSEGDATSIGYHEADDVYAAYQYLQNLGEENIILFGTSMGSAAILKSIYDHTFEPQAIVLECPFGSLHKTTCARFNNMGLPGFPAADMLLFWGGVQNHFEPFEHNPTTYARKVTCPTLILYGMLDDRVSEEEIDLIKANLEGQKHVVKYPERGHNDLFSDAWKQDVISFLEAPVTTSAQ